MEGTPLMSTSKVPDLTMIHADIITLYTLAGVRRSRLQKFKCWCLKTPSRTLLSSTQIILIIYELTSMLNERSTGSKRDYTPKEIAQLALSFKILHNPIFKGTNIFHWRKKIIGLGYVESRDIGIVQIGIFSICLRIAKSTRAFYFSKY